MFQLRLASNRRLGIIRAENVPNHCPSLVFVSTLTLLLLQRVVKGKESLMTTARLWLFVHQLENLECRYSYKSEFQVILIRVN